MAEAASVVERLAQRPPGARPRDRRRAGRGPTPTWRARSWRAAPPSSTPSTTTSARPTAFAALFDLVRAANRAIAGSRGGRRPAPRGPPRAAGAARRPRPRHDRARPRPRRARRGHGAARPARGGPRRPRLRRAPTRRATASGSSDSRSPTPRRALRSGRHEPPAPRAAADHEVVYGRNPVRELIAAGRRPVARGLGAAAARRGAVAGRRARRECTRAELGRRAGSSDHQGVAALTDPYPYADVGDLLARPGPVVCLDGAHDPRNLGAIARVAECAGAAGLAIPRRGGPGVTPTVAKASAGAVEYLRGRPGRERRRLRPRRPLGPVRGRRRRPGGRRRLPRDRRGPPTPCWCWAPRARGLRPRVRDGLRPPRHDPDGRARRRRSTSRSPPGSSLRGASQRELTLFACLWR